MSLKAAYEMYMKNEKTVGEIETLLGFSRSTIYRYIEKKSYASANQSI